MRIRGKNRVLLIIEQTTTGNKMTFIVGNKYTRTATFDRNITWDYVVLSRTQKTITLRETRKGTTLKRRVKICKHSGQEFVRPCNNSVHSSNLFA